MSSQNRDFFWEYLGWSALLLVFGVLAAPPLGFVAAMLGAKKIGLPIWIGVPIGFAGLIGTAVGLVAIYLHFPEFGSMSINFWMMGGAGILFFLSGLPIDYNMDKLNYSPLRTQIIWAVLWWLGILLGGLGFFAFLKNIYI